MRSRLVAVAAGLVLAVTALTCDTASETADRTAGIYAEVVQAMVGPEPFADVDDPADVTVWIYPLGDEAIDLEVQVEVLDLLDDYATIRFVDAFDEAVNEDKPGTPALADGVVVGLGPLRGEDPSEVRVERYVTEDDEPRRVMMRLVDGEWQPVTSDV